MNNKSTFDLGEPRQHPLGFPLPLYEKYRPRRIENFCGIEDVKLEMQALLAAPRPCNMLFVGPAGSGKTSMALAFVDQLPATLHHVSSQKCDAATLDAIWGRCQYESSRGRFHCIVVDEADEATDKANLQFLSRTDSTTGLRPAFGGGSEDGGGLAPILHIFTANGTGEDHTDPQYKFEKRFLSRCRVIRFPRATDEQIAAYLAAVHKAEGRDQLHEADFLVLASLSEGLRDALNRLESFHLRNVTEVKAPPPPAVVIPGNGKVAVPADKEAAALQFYGRPWGELQPAHRAWVTMRIKHGEAQ